MDKLLFYFIFAVLLPILALFSFYIFINFIRIETSLTWHHIIFYCYFHCAF